MTGRRTIPRLMLVTDPVRMRLPLADLIAEAVAGGVDAIYLRGTPGTGESGDARACISSTAEVVQELHACIGGEAALLVNGPVETARRLGAGLHLRERDPLPDDARLVLAPQSLLGRSVHSPEAAAELDGMDYLLAGHVYPSASKPGKAPLGLERFAAIVAAAPCPVLAIGGITAERVPEVIQAGAHGVAVIDAIARADDPRTAAASLRAALDRALSGQVQDANSAARLPERPLAATRRLPGPLR